VDEWAGESAQAAGAKAGGEMSMIDPSVKVRIEFDGGNGCNIPRLGYGNGYGSYRFNGSEPVRVEFGRPMSNNAAELWTLAEAVGVLRNLFQAGHLNILLVGDSQIALAWARKAHLRVSKEPSKKSSEEMRLAISRLRELLPAFASVSTLWQPRAMSVATFGH
jgi:ribonuclease HI